jgi:hypothetical protein
MLRKAAIALGILALIAAVLYFVFVWPWVAPPPESREHIEKRWQKLVALSFRAPRCAEDLEAISRWVETLGGPNPEGDPLRIGIDGFELLQEELKKSTALEDDGLVIALSSSRTLRQCGGLIQVIAGFKLADNLVEWVGKQNVEPDARFRLAAPRPEEIVAGLARDAVMIDEMIGDTVSDNVQGQRPSYLKPFFDIERERLWVRRQAVNSLLDENANVRSLDDIAKQYSIEADALPKSLLVRGTHPSVGNAVRKCNRTIQVYKEMLKWSK